MSSRCLNWCRLISASRLTLFQEVVKAMLQVQAEKSVPGRPVIFALSNPMSQAELTAEDCYKFSEGRAIFGSGTRFPPVQVKGKTRSPGQALVWFRGRLMYA